MGLQDLLERHGWRVMGPAPTVRAALLLLEGELPTVALLDVNLGGKERMTPVAEFLKARDVPFALASAYDRPEQWGDALAGAPNVGKPTNERGLIQTLTQLTSA